jgi:hypothetical protein
MKIGTLSGSFLDRGQHLWLSSTFLSVFPLSSLSGHTGSLARHAKVRLRHRWCNILVRFYENKQKPFRRKDGAVFVLEFLFKMMGIFFAFGQMCGDDREGGLKFFGCRVFENHFVCLSTCRFYHFNIFQGFHGDI